MLFIAFLLSILQETLRKFSLLVGTTTNSIVEVLFTLKKGNTEMQDLEVHPLVLGHYQVFKDLSSLSFYSTIYSVGQTTGGLSCQQWSPRFLTGGGDGRLTLWDSEGHSPLWSLQLQAPVLSVHLGPDPGVPVFAAGSAGGLLHVGTSQGGQVLSSRDMGGKVREVRISQDTRKMAVGLEDRIVIFGLHIEDNNKVEVVLINC